MVNPQQSGDRKRFARSTESLSEIHAFVERFFEREVIDREMLGNVAMAIEELFTNLVKYGAGEHEISIELTKGKGQLAVGVTDFDVERFDLTEAPEVRVDRPIEERRPGGLGIHLIKRVTDRIEYEYVDRRSRTTMFFDTEH